MFLILCRTYGLYCYYFINEQHITLSKYRNLIQKIFFSKKNSVIKTYTI